jgi:hypothetical protein
MSSPFAEKEENSELKKLTKKNKSNVHPQRGVNNKNDD